MQHTDTRVHVLVLFKASPLTHFEFVWEELANARLREAYAARVRAVLRAGPCAVQAVGPVALACRGAHARVFPLDGLLPRVRLLRLRHWSARPEAASRHVAAPAGTRELNFWTIVNLQGQVEIKKE